MLNRSIALLFVLSGSLLAACSQPTTPAPAAPAPPVADLAADIAAISAAREGFMKAYGAGDAAAIGELYTSDAISEPNGQATITGRDAIVTGLKSMFEQVEIKATLNSEEVKTLGNVGLDRGRYIVTVTPKAGAPPSTSEGRYLVIYRKDDDGTWRAWRDFDNVGLPAATPAAAAVPGS